MFKKYLTAHFGPASTSSSILDDSSEKKVFGVIFRGQISGVNYRGYLESYFGIQVIWNFRENLCIFGYISGVKFLGSNFWGQISGVTFMWSHLWGRISEVIFQGSYFQGYIFRAEFLRSYFLDQILRVMFPESYFIIWFRIHFRAKNDLFWPWN